ncbi:MAG: hypothetical protein A2V52_08590 [Actinobacteria bacterium RBG_19FT_COMBO_54_7]|uniref:VOC domain-containing protein n=1 Tax=Candidatus Solincola sediminis TaxID=1797199 RepID=A0A1F2WK96_9ACTN|nr:MAG: hypothetical protein A2Y75_07560 [Candidatus Solincola sediminis]OFW58823.1 MAG: hypothetical protein A2W01_01760 [Candidatus Solincola sediminis]OFW66578.1 MAG: hypothetical protein A2V52_08590 [Actinobacteria bacterium RBG_19FT_COMBO_54_7]
MISAFQSITIGVKDVEHSAGFYREFLGFSDVLDDSTDYLEELEPVIGALIQARKVTLRDKISGSVLHIVEHISTKPLPPLAPIEWGDTGYLELGLRAFHLEQLYLDLKSRGVDFITPVRSIDASSGRRGLYTYLRDPDGLLLQLVEIQGGERPRVAGIGHVGVGVGDMKKAQNFYADLLGLEETVYEFKGRFPELDEVTGGKDMEVALVARDMAALSPTIKLIHTPGYKGKPILEARRWGDIGIAEIALLVEDLNVVINRLIAGGVELMNPPAKIRDSSIYLSTPEEAVLKLVEEAEQTPSAIPPKTLKRALNRFKESARTMRTSKQEP